MLVLSRRADEKVVFPGLGISVHILRSTSSTVRLGIDAPREVAVLRGELAEQNAAARNCDGNHGDDSPMSRSFLARSTPMRTTIQQAASTLDQLLAFAERGDWSVAKNEIAQLFGHLRSLDEQAQGKPIAIPNRKTKRDSASTAPATGVARALLVDDNDNESRLLSSYLRIKGVEVSMASNGQEAMRMLEHDAPDVVLLDMNMPKFDGRWTIEQIRENRRLDQLTVFAVSGTPKAEANVEVGPRGVNSWFQKPLNPENLASAITQHMSSVLTCAN